MTAWTWVLVIAGGIIAAPLLIAGTVAALGLTLAGLGAAIDKTKNLGRRFRVR